MISSMKRAGILGIAFLAAMTTLCGCNRPVDLKLRLKEGDKRVLKIATSGKTTVDVMGNKHTVDEKTSLAYLFEVKSVDPNGTAAVNVTFEEMDLGFLDSMKLLGGAGVPDFEKQLKPLADALNLTGKSFTMKVMPTGRVEEVQGMSDAVEQMLAAFPSGEGPLGALGGMVKEVFGPQLANRMGDSATREQMDGCLAIYPDEPVAVGATWVKGRIINSGAAPQNCRETWTLKARENGVATLEMTAEITPNTDAPAQSMMGMTVENAVSGTQTGTLSVDEATGWITSGAINQNVSVKTTLKEVGMTSTAESVRTSTIETHAR